MPRGVIFLAVVVAECWATRGEPGGPSKSQRESSEVLPVVEAGEVSECLDELIDHYPKFFEGARQVVTADDEGRPLRNEGPAPIEDKGAIVVSSEDAG